MNVEEGRVISSSGVCQESISSRPIEISLFLFGLPFVVGASLAVGFLAFGIAVGVFVLKAAQFALKPTMPPSIGLEYLHRTILAIILVFRNFGGWTTKLARSVAVGSGRIQVAWYDIVREDGTTGRVRISGVMSGELAEVGDEIVTTKVVSLDNFLPVRRFENRTRGTTTRIFKPAFWWFSSISIAFLTAVYLVIFVAFLMHR